MISERHSFLYLKGKEVGKAQKEVDEQRREQSARKKNSRNIGLLTLMGAKSIFPICIKVFGCGTPEEPIVASCICAAVVFLAIEPEGKFAIFTICISVLHSDHYKENKCSGEISHQLRQKIQFLDIFFSWKILI